jgi:hypothetical protein
MDKLADDWFGFPIRFVLELFKDGLPVVVENYVDR